MRSIILAFALVNATAAFADDCPNSGYDDASISANGVTRVVIAGPSDLLLVTGKADAKDIRAMGSRCLPHGELTAGFRLTATKNRRHGSDRRRLRRKMHINRSIAVDYERIAGRVISNAAP